MKLIIKINSSHLSFCLSFRIYKLKVWLNLLQLNYYLLHLLQPRTILFQNLLPVWLCAFWEGDEQFPWIDLKRCCYLLLLLMFLWQYQALFLFAFSELLRMIPACCLLNHSCFPLAPLRGLRCWYLHATLQAICELHQNLHEKSCHTQW